MSSVVDRRAIAAAAATGLVLIAAVSVLRALIDRAVDDFDDSPWIVVFALAQLGAYAVAGAVAGVRAPAAPLTNGGLGALVAVLCWIPLRVVVWLVRDEHRGLWSGGDPVFELGPVFVALVLALALGMAGGALGARSARAGSS